jgi:hypothetical protein
VENGYQGAERRRAPRVPLCLAVAAECDAWMEACVTKDISESGVFVISQRLPSISSGFSVEIQLPGDLGRLRLRGAVARVQGASPRGFGLEWRNRDEKSGQILVDLWERWSRTFGTGQA